MAKRRKNQLAAGGDKRARKTPRTLLEHPARFTGQGYELDSRAPKRILAFANHWLAARRITTEEAMRRVMDKEADDPVAHDAAWLRVHSLKGQKIINSLPKYESVLRKLWAEAFHAGARHESITVNLRYLADVQVGHPRRTVLPARARAARMEKRDVAQYKIALQEAGGIRKKLFSILGMSGQGVRDFERRHPELKKTK